MELEYKTKIICTKCDWEYWSVNDFGISTDSLGECKCPVTACGGFLDAIRILKKPSPVSGYPVGGISLA